MGLLIVLRCRHFLSAKAFQYNTVTFLIMLEMGNIQEIVYTLGMNNPLSIEFSDSQPNYKKIESIFIKYEPSELALMIPDITDTYELYIFMLLHSNLRTKFEQVYKLQRFKAGDTYFQKNWTYESMSIHFLGHQSVGRQVSRNLDHKAVELTADLLLKEGIDRLGIGSSKLTLEEFTIKAAAQTALIHTVQIAANFSSDSLCHSMKYQTLVRQIFDVPEAIEFIYEAGSIRGLIVDDATAEKLLFLDSMIDSAEHFQRQKFVEDILIRTPRIASKYMNKLYDYFNPKSLAEALKRVPVDQNHPMVQEILKVNEYENGVFHVRAHLGVHSLHPANAWFARAFEKGLQS